MASISPASHYAPRRNWVIPYSMWMRRSPRKSPKRSSVRPVRSGCEFCSNRLNLDRYPRPGDKPAGSIRPPIILKQHLNHYAAPIEQNVPAGLVPSPARRRLFLRRWNHLVNAARTVEVNAAAAVDIHTPGIDRQFPGNPGGRPIREDVVNLKIGE